MTYEIKISPVVVLALMVEAVNKTPEDLEVLLRRLLIWRFKSSLKITLTSINTNLRMKIMVKQKSKNL